MVPNDCGHENEKRLCDTKNKRVYKAVRLALRQLIVSGCLVDKKLYIVIFENGLR
ncbi:hypothetical protein SARC_17377, partial [Sphaeroforma arctica JP610]